MEDKDVGEKRKKKARQLIIEKKGQTGKKRRWVGAKKTREERGEGGGQGRGETIDRRDKEN